MRVLILRSCRQTAQLRTRDTYSVTMDTRYATRFLSHFSNQPGYCRACGKECRHCRTHYQLDFSSHLAGTISFPASLPLLLEEPEDLLPAEVPPHDILLALAVHEELLMAFLKKFPLCRALLVPQEAPSWLSPFGQKALAEFCQSRQIEYAFPRPFCSFAPHNGLLREFQQTFRLGKPQLKFTVANDHIQTAEVLVSAPCGATYFTAQRLMGRCLKDNLPFVIENALSCFPCTASTEVDREYNDSLMHKAAHLQLDILSGPDIPA